MQMKTISKMYQPMAPGKNTIRLASEKYVQLNPGDIVKMNYHETCTSPFYASEWFKIARIVEGRIGDIFDHIWKDNHSWKESKTELLETLSRVYPDTEITEDTEIIAIYAG